MGFLETTQTIHFWYTLRWLRICTCHLFGLAYFVCLFPFCGLGLYSCCGSHHYSRRCVVGFRELFGSSWSSICIKRVDFIIRWGHADSTRSRLYFGVYGSLGLWINSLWELNVLIHPQVCLSRSKCTAARCCEVFQDGIESTWEIFCREHEISVMLL